MEIIIAVSFFTNELSCGSGNGDYTVALTKTPVGFVFLNGMVLIRMEDDEAKILPGKFEKLKGKKIADLKSISLSDFSLTSFVAIKKYWGYGVSNDGALVYSDLKTTENSLSFNLCKTAASKKSSALPFGHPS